MNVSLASAATGLLLAVFSAGLPAVAAEKPRLKAPEYYKDLPGVTLPGMTEEPAYRCETVTRHTDAVDGVEFFADGMPVIVYRCTRGDVTFESRNPPLSPKWYPGINPQSLGQ